MEKICNAYQIFEDKSASNMCLQYFLLGVSFCSYTVFNF